jgi:CheY-like chemotaxis protein
LGVPAHADPVLLVEDHADMREAVATMLRLDGFDVLIADNGAEALRVLRTQQRPARSCSTCTCLSWTASSFGES